MQDHPTALVRLDRAQREAIRREIWIRSSGVADLALPLDPKDDHCFKRLGRAFVVEWLERLHGMVDMLDAIGWRETHDQGEDQPVTISPELAAWARRIRAELKEGLEDGYAKDEDLDALTGLALVGEAI